jgi:hypothetical protein
MTTVVASAKSGMERTRVLVPRLDRAYGAHRVHPNANCDGMKTPSRYCFASGALSTFLQSEGNCASVMPCGGFAGSLGGSG